MEENNKPKILDILKKKALNYLIDYFKKNIKEIKKDVFKSIERKIEKKIKRIISNMITKSIGIMSLIFGSLILFYGIISAVVTILFLPEYFISIFYGLFLILIGFIFLII